MQVMTRTPRDRRRHASVDAFLDRHVPDGHRATYDSAVVAGNGIGALTFAAALSRQPGFEGKVTVVAPPIVESRRLMAGVSLRGRAADFLAHAFDTTHDVLLDTFAGSGKRPIASRQTACFADCEPSGAVRLSTVGTWQGRGASGANPLVYGLRNDRVTAGLAQFLIEHGDVEFVHATAESAEQLRDHARGSRPLLVNATTNPRLLGNESTKPTHLVLATQVPFVEEGDAPSDARTHRTTLAPLLRRDGIIDVGYYTPFADPLSPRSTWYGIIARVVAADSGFEKERELAVMTDELFAVGAELGLLPDDPDETLGRALVPSAPFGAIGSSAPGTLELRRSYAGGHPCYYADGMISAAIGGAVGAECVARGVADPGAAVRAALKPWRTVNRLWSLETNTVAAVSERLVKLNVRLAMAFPHTTSQRLWESAA